MKKLAVRILWLPLALAACGCGFQPMYGPGLEPQLAAIYVEPVAERDGYELRNSLIDLLGSNGTMAGKRYRLTITLKETNQGVALQNDTAITRYNDTLAADFTLTDLNGKTITSGSQDGLTAYNVATAPYATLVAQQDADTRAAQDIAERIRLDLAAFFPAAQMIVKSHEADRFVARPPVALQAALVLGPDAGLVQERAEKLLRGVVPDLTDPFNAVDLTEKALLDDPARLFDEAAAISMMGGRRVIRVRGGGNDLAVLAQSFLQGHCGDALVVIEAGDLGKASALRKLFADDDSAVAIECYPDSASTLPNVVRDELRALGFSLASGAVEEAVARLGNDRGVTRRELEKLALYAQGQKQITADDVRAVMGDEAQVRSESAFDAAGSGDYGRLDLELERLWQADTAPAQLLRGALAHFQRLALANEGLARGESINSAMRKFRPPIHFSRAESFKAQARTWNGGRLADALDLLLDAEALSRTTAMPGEAVTHRALMSVAALARAKG